MREETTTLDRLAERLLAGEPVLAELHDAALHRIDDAGAEIPPAERAFLDEVRYAVPAIEEGPAGGGRRARARLLAAADAFRRSVRSA
jgi:hypothetical protein